MHSLSALLHHPTSESNDQRKSTPPDKYHQATEQSKMERQDGKDPFDAKTYTVPATTMMTMVELRVFCVDFVERHIRVNTSALEDELMGPFINLITHSNGLFSRARAVIPELQIPQEEGSSSHPNPNVQRLLQATRDWRGPAHKKWDDLAEEPFWAKLARDQKAANDKKEHKKQSSVSSLDRFGSRFFWDCLYFLFEKKLTL